VRARRELKKGLKTRARRSHFLGSANFFFIYDKKARLAKKSLLSLPHLSGFSHMAARRKTKQGYAFMA
jgi:hypothetical protein